MKFFLVKKLFCIFIKYRSKIFFVEVFFFYKIVDFEIWKKELRVRLKSFFLICDACIVSLSHECETSFKSLFYLLSKTDLIFTNQISFFLSFKKTDLNFTNPISFFLTLPKKKKKIKSNLFFFFLTLQKIDLIFLDKI